MPQRRTESEWNDIEREWRSSGKQIEIFSKNRHISPTAFRRYLKTKTLITEPTQELPIVELGTVSDGPASSGISLRIDQRVIIELRSNFNSKTLAAVLRALGIGG